MDLPQIPIKNEGRTTDQIDSHDKDMDILIVSPMSYTFLIMVSITATNKFVINLDILNCGTGSTRAYVCLSNPGNATCHGKLKIWTILGKLKDLYHGYSLGTHIIARGYDRITGQYVETIDTKFLSIKGRSIRTNNYDFCYDDFVIESMD